MATLRIFSEAALISNCDNFPKVLTVRIGVLGLFDGPAIGAGELFMRKRERIRCCVSRAIDRISRDAAA